MTIIFSLPGQVWSETRRSRGFPAPRSCWPTRQKCEPGSRRVTAAGTAARSRGVPSTRCWEKTWPCSRWPDSLDVICCRQVGGWWCSHHRTCRVKSGAKRGHHLHVARFVCFLWILNIGLVEFCKTPLAIRWKFSRVSLASVYLFFRCCTDPRHWNLPLTMMAILVQRASHSSILRTHVWRNSQKTTTVQTRPSTILRPSVMYTAPYLCEVRTTALPSLVTLRMQFHRNLLAFGSIPVVGSS